jgi:hypothetical protein
MIKQIIHEWEDIATQLTSKTTFWHLANLLLHLKPFKPSATTSLSEEKLGSRASR